MNTLSDARSRIPYTNTDEKIQQKRKTVLYDMSIQSAEKAFEEKPENNTYKTALARLLLDRALFAPIGERGEMLKKSIELYSTATSFKTNSSDKMTGNTYNEQITQARLYLCSEVEPEEIGALLDSAFESYCLAAGLPSGSARAKTGWATALAYYADNEKMSEPAADAMRAKAKHLRTP